MDAYQIPRLASRYMHHDMIEKYADLPEFPHLRTRLLHIFLQKGGIPSVMGNELYALVTSLLQLGLDTHDRVDNDSRGLDDFRKRAMQLKVLAGDYFSSRFYYLLSQAEQIDLVKRLSSAVCEVNRLKMNMYVKMRRLQLSAEDYLHHMVKIKSQLFLGFSHLMEGLYQKYWPAILKGFTRCEIIAGELEQLSAESSKGTVNYGESWAYWYLLAKANTEDKQKLTDGVHLTCFRTMTDKYGLRQKLLDMLEQQVNELIETIEQFHNGGLAKELVSELRQIGEKFQRLVSASTVPENIMR